MLQHFIRWWQGQYKPQSGMLYVKHRHPSYPNTWDSWVSPSVKIQRDFCLFIDDSCILDFATIRDSIVEDSTVEGMAVVDDSRVKGSRISGKACLCNAKIRGSVWVSDNARVRERATVQGHAIIRGHALVTKGANVLDHAVVEGRACVEGCETSIGGHAFITGRSSVRNSVVGGYAYIQDTCLSGGSIGGHVLLKDSILELRNSVLDGDLHIAGVRFQTMLDSLHWWSDVP